MKNRKRAIIIITVAILPIIIAIFAFRCDLKEVIYNIETAKSNEDIKIAFISDLHSCDYGEDQADIVRIIKQSGPDLVLLGGDIFDDHLPRQKAMEFLSEVSKDYPCYYVSGNHEFWSGEIDEIKAEIEAYGITVLEGERVDLKINGQGISLYGIDDPEIGEDEFARQLKICGENIDDKIYSVLLTHRPERIDSYLQYDFDLILAGHTHGGQLRVPLFINGLFAPDQGWFPRYAGGIYEFDRSQMIVSRGATSQKIRIPRIFNRPEIVFVNIKDTNAK